MLYCQPIAVRFGSELTKHINSGTWSNIDIAVAWIRASGMNHLGPALEMFLGNGGHLSVVVGIDFDNTTKEGLELLLKLESIGDVTIFINHNEAGSIFHPKLYLLRNPKRAKLIVGSNNITGAGLYQNTEVGLEVDTDASDPIVVAASNAIAGWRDTSLGIARKLDSSFLGQLVAEGYVKSEAAVKADLAARRAAAKKAAGVSGKKLFGNVYYAAPTLSNNPSSPTAQTPPAGKASKTSTAKIIAPIKKSTSPGLAIGQVLLMRVRKARGTQIQIPLRVLSTPFFGSATSVISVATGVTRGIHPTHSTRAGAGSNPNTLKLEMPETSTMADPVARFQRTPTGIQYEVYDAKSPQGYSIMQVLNQGLKASPPSTFLTVPSAPLNATWWRFI